MLIMAPPDEAPLTAFYLPPDEVKGYQYGPTLVSRGGGVFSDLTAVDLDKVPGGIFGSP